MPFQNTKTHFHPAKLMLKVSSEPAKSNIGQPSARTAQKKSKETVTFLQLTNAK
jgi:hypothetical protein